MGWFSPRTREGTPALRARARGLPWVGSTLRVTRDQWRNWSTELASTPRRLYCDEAGGPWRAPRTLDDLQAIVRDARREGVTVRVFGSSHSWSRLVPNDGGFLVDNRMIGARPDGTYDVRIEPGSADGLRKARATVPPGVLSGELEAWLWEAGYSLPASAVEDVFSVGGMTATATHGTGYACGTVSDLVAGMTFVDGRGEVRRWTRETATADELAAIQCGLGCLGLVYDVTFEVEPAYEVLHEAVCVPYDSLFADTDEARERLRTLHESHTSVEYFWWPIRFSGLPLVSKPEVNPEVWVLTTQKAFPRGIAPRSAMKRFWDLQVLDMASMAGCGRLMDAVEGRPWAPRVLAWVTCFTNLWVSSRSGRTRLPQYDANHFVNAGGVEFVRAMAAEWSLPFRRDLPLAHPGGYERVRRAFAELHDLVVDAFHRYPFGDPRATPITLAVEMRTLATSTALMSPGYSASRDPMEAIVAPELVTTAGHPAWAAFAERANLAMTTQPAVFGDRVRCHQAKPCHGLAHPDFPRTGMQSYLRAQYRAAGTWERFLAVRDAVDPDGVFLNPYLRAWFFPEAARDERAPTEPPAFTAQEASP